MHRIAPNFFLASTLALGAALPAWAHVTVPASPHLHASDLAGLGVVVVLTVAAGWLDRRLQRARRRTRDGVVPSPREGRAGHTDTDAGSR
jgi:hypothetical protein